MVQWMRVQKATEWRERFDRFRRAGTSVARFCRDEGLSVSSFYFWRRKLGQRRPSNREQFPRDANRQPRQGSFVPVRVIGGGNSEGQVAAQLPGGTRLEIPVADPQTLQIAIAALVRADAERAGGVPC